MKQRSVIVMVTFVLLWMTLTILYAVRKQEPTEDAGCKNQFGRVVECPVQTRQNSTGEKDDI